MTLPRGIILLSTADWDYPFRTNKQHMACALADSGFRVLFVESIGLRQPTASGRDLARMGRRLAKGIRGFRHVHENIWVFSPLVVPFHRWRLVRKLNDLILTQALRLAACWLGFTNPIIWTYNPLVTRLVHRLRGSLLVYHCVDNLTASPHVAAEVIQESEPELIRAADVVFTTSPALQAACAHHNPSSSYYFPNVADFAHFARARQPGPIPADLASIPRPRIGFMGAVSSYKVDFSLIAEMARRKPAWHWVLVGQVGEGQPGTSVECLQLPNVHLLGPRRYDDLPDYLRGFDVATVPAPRNAYTEAMFPMKFFEYLGAGKPVIAVNTPALREFAHACRLSDSPEEFYDALEQVLSGRGFNPKLGVQLASQFTWEWRTAAMLEILEDRYRAKSHRIPSENPGPFPRFQPGIRATTIR